MPELNRKELKRKINNKEFSNLYIIYGEEKMYVKNDTEYLIAKLMGKEPPEFNFHSFVKEYDLDKIAVAVQVAPFMSQYNCVKIADFDLNDCDKSTVERFLEIIKNAPDTTVVVITMPTLEQDSKKLGNFSKLLKLVEKTGVVCEIKKESDISLAQQIIKWADKRDIKIEQADAYKLQEYVGFDLNSIKNELDKLCNFVGDGKQITTKHIEQIVSKRAEANIFNLTDAIVSGNSSEAYRIIDVLFYQKEDANNILNIIGMAYIDFYRVRIARECGVPLSQIAADFGYGKREFVLKKAEQKIKSVSTQSLRNSLDDIINTFSQLRSTGVNQRIVLEALVAKLILHATKGE